MQGRRKYTLKEIQAEHRGSIGKETMNTNLNTRLLRASQKRWYLNWALKNDFYFNRQKRTWESLSGSVISMNKGTEVSENIESSQQPSEANVIHYVLSVL